MESIRISCAMYSRLLAAYPQDFRARFGGEMVTVFGEQLADSWQNARVSGVIRVWLGAFWELLSVAFPLRLASPTVWAIAVSIPSTTVVFLGLLRLVAPHCAK